MGLDSYIYKTKKTNHTINEMVELDNREDLKPDLLDAKDFLPLREYEFLRGHYSIFHEVTYWRKFNAIHNYFVTNHQGGVDECQTTEIPKDGLVKLLSILKEVAETKDSSLLEPVSGFFFGSTDVDDYYFEDVKDAIDRISKVIEETDWENERVFYRASW
jgi:hypothetical protein